MTDLNTNIKLCAYYFASEAFNKGKKIIESFIPLVEAVIHAYPAKKSFSFLDLKAKINETFDVDMPSATLINLLSVMSNMGTISLDRQRKVSRAIVNEEYWDRRNNVESDIDALFFAFREHLIERGIHIEYDEAKKVVCTYVFSYSFELADFICGAINKPELHENEPSIPYVEELCDFLFAEKEQNSSSYQSFIRLYEGAIQSSLLNFTPNEINNITIEKFVITNVILDANFIMRILNIQTEIECQSATETLKSLNSLGTSLTVLEQTIHEICNSIKSFLEDSQGYIAQTREYFCKQRIRSTGLFDAIMRGATTSVKLLKLSTYDALKEALQHIGINVVEDESFDLPEKDVQSLIKFKDKPYYAGALAEHDLSLISYCRKKRDKHADSLETAKWWVLTNDFLLTYWNQKNKKTSLQECITESQIANLLWLSQKKTYNNGLSNTMVTLANSQLLSPSEIGTVAIKMHRLAENVKKDNEMVDKLAIVHASDCMTENDVRRVSADEISIEDLVKEKALQINSESQKHEQEHQNQIKDMQSKKQESDTKISELQNIARKIEVIDAEVSIDQSQLLKIIDQCSSINGQVENVRLICNKLESVCEYKSTIDKSSGRIICGLYIVGYFLYIGLLLAIYKPLVSCIASHVPSNINNSIISIAYTLFSAGIGFFVPAMVTGTFKKPSDAFDYFKKCLIERRSNKYAADRKICWKDTLERALIIMNSQLSESQEKFNTCTQKRQDLEALIKQKTAAKAGLIKLMTQ